MAILNGVSYSSPRNINLKDIKGGVIRFDATRSSNPLSSTSNGIYVNSSNQLVFSSQGSATILGAAGGGNSVASFDQLIANDQIMVNATGSPFIIDVSSGNINSLRLTSTVAGTGDLLQITNAGTGKDINGTSSTWYVSKAGAAVFASETISGTAGSTIFTVTAGDLVVSDGSLAITDADNAATFSVTNDSATSASMFVIAGSGAFTGNTTSSFMTLTASGATTGTVLYIPVAALTTGKGINLIGTTALTTGIMLNVESGTTGTSLTGNGRLLRVAHTGTATSSGILAEFTSAATDETVILQVTASAALALGAALKLSTAAVTTGSLISALGAALTTGSVFSCTDLAGLTTGTGISLAHATSVIADGGSMIRLASTGINTGGATNGTMLDIQTTAQVLGTQVLIKAGAVTSGVLLSLVTTTAMTSGSVIRATTSSAGACATNGFFSFNASGAFTSGAATLGAFHVAGAATLSGTIMSILGGAQTTGVALYISDPSTGMTSGSLLRVVTATTGAVATNGIVSIQASGAYTSTSNAGLLDVQSATATGTTMRISSTAITSGQSLVILHAGAGQTSANAIKVVQSTTTTGYTGALVDLTSSSTTGASQGIKLTMVNTVAGDGILINSNALTLGAGTAINVAHTTSVLGAGTSLVRISSTGVDTGTTTGTLLDLSQTAAAQNVAVLFTDASADVNARSVFKINVTNAAAVLAKPIDIQNAAVQGTGSKFKKMMVLGGVTLWVSIDGTTANGALTATAGDICFNGGSNKPEYCTGTNSWTALV